MKRASLPLSDRMLELIAKRFRLMGEPQRLRILQALETGEKSVGDICETTQASQPNVSKHLAALFEGGLIVRRKQGNNVLYAIGDPLVFKLCELVCRGAAEQFKTTAAELAQAKAALAKG